MVALAVKGAEGVLPEGYRWLVVGETLADTDLFFAYCDHGWVTTSMAGHTIGGSPDPQKRYIRKLVVVDPVASLGLA